MRTLVRGHSGTLWWIAIGLILVLVVWKFWAFSNDLARQADENAKRTQENHALIVQVRDQAASIKELQTEARDNCGNFIVLRNAVNRFHGTLSKFLLAAEHAREKNYRASHLRADLTAARVYKKLYRSLKTVKQTCTQRR